ncbi:MAG TPA: PBP1A family penicillin-binding protein [Pseudogracilibacillus sp.]|nr:PBP1A family penicillin-binding protein [Pseudogracilibacillus sp.]
MSKHTSRVERKRIEEEKRKQKKQEEKEQKKPPKRSKFSRQKTWVKALILALFAIVVVFIIGLVSVINMILKTPELEASDLKTPLSTQIYSQDEELIGTMFQEENRLQVDIDEVPEEMKEAVVSIEDKRFYEHKGIDFRRIFKAVLSNLTQGWGSEGGSTITQQVIKRSVLSSEKTLTRKVQEAWLARKLEQEYSKDEILELYINNVYLGNKSYGVKTASKAYFNKDIKDINLSQIALLAGLPNSPSMDNPIEHPERAEKRRNQVLQSMMNNQIISEEEAEEAKELSIDDILEEDDSTEADNESSNAFIDTVYSELVEEKEVISEEEFYQGGLKIHTTTDTEMQEAVYDAMHSEDFPFPDDNFETGIALIDTKSGEVQAIGGGRNFQSIQDVNYGVSVPHQPGSTIKPILSYGPAIDELKWSTEHNLKDEEYEYNDGTPVKEWDGEYWGDISLRRSLEWSRNIPAIKAFKEVGADKTKEFAKDLGIDVDTDNESAALGGFNGTSPLQLASAYAAFGNEGEYNEPSVVKKIEYPDGDKWEPDIETNDAMEAHTAYMVTDMLKTVIKSGTGTKANVEGLPVAGKTGSTNIPKDIQEENGINEGLIDSWFVGYTPEYTLAIWTGYPSLEGEDDELQYIPEDGTEDIPRLMFQHLMSDLSDFSMEDFKKPDDVISVDSELYIEGTEPAEEEQDNEENEDEYEDNDDQNDYDEDEYNNDDEYDNDEEEDYEDYNNDDYQDEDEDEYQEENEDEYQENND